eukprot:g806.t1
MLASSYRPAVARTIFLIRRKSASSYRPSKISIAPMMKITDRHYRHMMDLLVHRGRRHVDIVESDRKTKRDHTTSACNNRKIVSPGLLTQYTEMYAANFLVHGDPDLRDDALRLPPFVTSSNRTVLQIGGNCPRTFRSVGELVASSLSPTTPNASTYAAININVGCPSPRVSGKGQFGASLMRHPRNVGALARELFEGTGETVPVTVKCRIGVADSVRELRERREGTEAEEEEFERLCEFVRLVRETSEGVVDHFDVHARCAVLARNFNPKQNRQVPPLKYRHVYRLCDVFPDLSFTLNGGVNTVEDVREIFRYSNGPGSVMIGRASRDSPLEVERMVRAFAPAPLSSSTTMTTAIGKRDAQLSIVDVVRQYAQYAESEIERKPALSAQTLLAPLMNLFAGERGAKAFRRALSECTKGDWNAPVDFVERAIARIPAAP